MNQENPIVQALSSIDLSLGVSDDFLQERKKKYKDRKLKLVRFSPPSEGHADITLYSAYGEVMVQLSHPLKTVHVTLSRFEKLVSDPSFYPPDGTWSIDPPLDEDLQNG